MLFAFRNNKIILNRKFRVATEIGSTFFGCWSVDKERNYKLGLILYRFLIERAPSWLILVFRD
jgi:hypothetical protein